MVPIPRGPVRSSELGSVRVRRAFGYSQRWNHQLFQSVDRKLWVQCTKESALWDTRRCCGDHCLCIEWVSWRLLPTADACGVPAHVVCKYRDASDYCFANLERYWPFGWVLHDTGASSDRCHSFVSYLEQYCRIHEEDHSRSSLSDWVLHRQYHRTADLSAFRCASLRLRRGHDSRMLWSVYCRSFVYQLVVPTREQAQGSYQG
jgi:hypothetical protein